MFTYFYKEYLKKLELMEELAAETADAEGRAQLGLKLEFYRKELEHYRAQLLELIARLDAVSAGVEPEAAEQPDPDQGPDQAPAEPEPDPEAGIEKLTLEHVFESSDGAGPRVFRSRLEELMKQATAADESAAEPVPISGPVIPELPDEPEPDDPWQGKKRLSDLLAGEDVFQADLPMETSEAGPEPGKPSPPEPEPEPQPEPPAPVDEKIVAGIQEVREEILGLLAGRSRDKAAGGLSQYLRLYRLKKIIDEDMDPGEEAVLDYLEKLAAGASSPRGERVLTENPTLDFFMLLNEAAAQMYEAVGELEAAVERLDRGLELSPDNPRVHFLLGSIYAANKVWALARQHLSQVRKAAPNSFWANKATRILTDNRIHLLQDEA